MTGHDRVRRDRALSLGPPGSYNDLDAELESVVDSIRGLQSTDDLSPEFGELHTRLQERWTELLKQKALREQNVGDKKLQVRECF